MMKVTLADKTALEYARNCAGWFRYFKDVDTEVHVTSVDFRKRELRL